MAQGSNVTCGNASASSNVVDGQQSPVERADDRSKTPRHPRWTRQETLILIEGKRLAEERGRNGRRSSSVFGSDQVEAKWDYVSSHCRRNGVSRGPIQCRKRWSNLLSDFKKIKTWDSCVEREGESFWTMKSDFRRERKLPGFYDREVYDVLDGREFTGPAYQLALVTVSAYESNGDGLDGLELDDEDEMMDNEEGGDGVFSEFEQVGEEELKEKFQTNGKTKTIPSPVPISEMKYQPFHQANSNQGTGKKRGLDSQFWRESEFQEGERKRKQSSSDRLNIDVGNLLIKALERNNDLLSAQLEDQKMHFQLAREQHKEQHDRINAALTKISGALEKIADKL
ncbi:hypothetical protein C2S52_018946 [Perilla frutescens var. hirtella]|uniref:Myb-like domain-containing protein n=1 Tax=Perilla frutescens var. hirtella TaxID=608512 RepID=A0AAD4J925_PERFH|nr:hypothetical protein C2S52_018946 [Perilla frutescens var. hirtella]KAH6829430.1 hypothetical protein C2S53_018448 [Perilla frutescens var. hirtella]